MTETWATQAARAASFATLWPSVEWLIFTRRVEGRVDRDKVLAEAMRTPMPPSELVRWVVDK